MPAISIAMATYNGASYLTAQLESLAAQSVLPAEVVVCDDGSTDESLTILESFKAPFPIRIHRNAENLGYRGNFMKAASLCRGDLIAFCDQDDVWLPTKLEECLKVFNDRDVLLAYHNATVVDNDLRPTGQLSRYAAPSSNPAQSLDPMHFALGFTQVFDRSLLSFNDDWKRSVDFNDTNKPEGHDQWFFFLASALGKIIYLNEPLALYRRHQGSVTSLVKRPMWKEKIIHFFSPNLMPVFRREKCARYRAEVIREAHNKLGYGYRRNAESAFMGYFKLRTVCSMRREMYQSESLIFRLKTFFGLINGYGYSSRLNWGAGWQAAVRDILQGLILGIKIP